MILYIYIYHERDYEFTMQECGQTFRYLRSPLYWTWSVCHRSVVAVVAAHPMDYSYLWNVSLFQELMEELKIVHGLAYMPLLKYLIFLRCRPPRHEDMIKINVIALTNERWVSIHIFSRRTDRSTLTTRDAKLIFDAYTSFAFDPCFPSI